MQKDIIINYIIIYKERNIFIKNIHYRIMLHLGLHAGG